MASVIAWKRYRVDQAQDLPDSSGYAWMRESMTRENKLALIVGFGLVLFMGILAINRAILILKLVIKEVKCR